MKFLVVIVLVTLASVTLSFGVTTHYINDFRFDNLDNVDASNVSFIENGGIELSRSYKVLLKSSAILWDIENWKGGFLCSSGDIATLQFVTETGHETVFTSSNHILFSDIQSWNGHIYLSGIPKATIFKLDDAYRTLSKTALSNEYIWQMIPSGEGLVLLTGNPSAVYLLEESGQVRLLADVPTEENLIKGVITGKNLYFTGDGNTLYKLPLKNDKSAKPVALASFDNPVADLLYRDGTIYLITAPKESVRSSSVSGGGNDETSKSPNQDKRSSRSTGGRNALYACGLDGTVSEIFTKNNVRFLSLNSIGNSLIVGIDRNAGYYEVPLDREDRIKFSGLGNGKFARFVSSGGDLYGVLLEPSRIIRIGKNYSSKGYFLSSPFDTGNRSVWGKLDPSFDLLPGTDIRITTRSGAVQNEDLWDEWQPAGESTLSGPNRFFQYRIELSSDGKNTPVFRNLTVPYVQDNIAPKIEKISFNLNNAGVYKVTWDASDENKDTLIYDVYIAKKENEWVLFNDKPLEDPAIELPTSLFPDGEYRLKITASDERSNPATGSKKTFSVSDPFTIDNTPPQISEFKTSVEGKSTIIRFTASDTQSDLNDAAYSVNGGKWIKFLPVKGLFDSRNGAFELKLRLDTPCSLQIKVADIFGNVTAKGIFFGK